MVLMQILVQLKDIRYKELHHSIREGPLFYWSRIENVEKNCSQKGKAKIYCL